MCGGLTAKAALNVPLENLVGARWVFREWDGHAGATISADKPDLNLLTHNALHDTFTP
jgi:hypothetical protein